MAQLDRMQRHGDNPKSPSGLTVEQVLRGGEGSKWSTTSSSSPYTFWKDHRDPEEDYAAHHHKKSVLAKVKDKAKKIRRSLSKKKHSEDGSSTGGSATTPSWGVSLDDDEDDEDAEYAEYLGAPMYESELAPEGYKETARQHPRAVHVVSEKHVLACSVNLGGADQQEKQKPTMTETTTANKKLSPLDEKTHAIASKFQGLTISAPTASQTVSGEEAPQPLSCRWPAPQIYSTPASPQAYSAPAAPHSGNASFGEQIWDKGVSVKEYLIHKIEPGDDERALSQVISEKMSPRRTPGDMGVVEKVKEAVTSLLRNESSKYSTVSTAANLATNTQISANARSVAKNSPSHLPISINAREVGDEENHGRILQAN